MLKLMILLFPVAAAIALPVNPDDAAAAASARLLRDGVADEFEISGCTRIESSGGGALLAWAFELEPAGYVIVSADDILPPVIAYSYTDGLEGPDGSFGMTDLVRLDLGQRLALADQVPAGEIEHNRMQWVRCTSGVVPSNLDPLEQWPPAGWTPTGGWLEENWTQSAPYNAYCPMDLIAGSRSAAGCPAVAMGMIVDNLETAMSMYFTDADDYYHNYHEYYWIDDDYVAHDFPSWSELNSLLDTLESHYVSSTPLTDSDKAALVAACGFACKQVFTASVSGTFGVDQAYDAYVRFGFWDCELLYDSSDSLFEKLSSNMMTANCAHLAIIDEGPNYGHNVVLDGYNTDDFYHINFGWGGSYNGWYQFPLTGMPYQMNIIEGIVLNIGVGMTGIGDTPQDGAQLVSLSCSANPCASDPVITIDLAEGASVDVSVFGLDGRRIDVLEHGWLGAGEHLIQWNAGDVPPGVYLVRAAASGSQSVMKVTLFR
jgi:hypothetical protein